MGVYIYSDEWLPWENTLLYMPLNWSSKDEASWNYGTWSWTEQYQTLASWLKVANCNTSSYILTPSFAMNTALTLSWWLYRSSWELFVRCDGRWGTRNFYQISAAATQAWGAWYYNGTAYWWEGWDGNWWQNCVLTCWSNWVNVYVNWANVYSNTSVTSFVWKTQQWGINFDQYSTSEPIHWAWFYSNIIVENKAWTAQEVANYYNTLKSKYWIS